MAMYVSPGVYTKIIDLSEYVRSVPSTIGFICIYAPKGPDREFILTNARDFFLDFGEPNITYGGKEFGQGMYVAANFLKNSDSLYVIRVTQEDAAYSNVAFVVDMATIDLEYGTPPKVYPMSFTDLNTEDELRALVGITIDPTTLEIESAGAMSNDLLLTSNGADFGLTAEYMANDMVPNCPLVLIGAGRGEWYNNFKIGLTPHSNSQLRAQGIYVLDIYKRQTQDAWVDIGDRPVVWKDNDELVGDETNCGIEFGGTSFDPEAEAYTAYEDCKDQRGYYTPQYEIAYSFEVSFDPDQLDDSGDSMFIADVINQYVREIEAIADVEVCQQLVAITANIDPIDWSEYFVELVWEDEAETVPMLDPFQEALGLEVQLTRSTPILMENGEDGQYSQYSTDSTERTNWRTAMLAEMVKAYQGQLVRVKSKDPLAVTAGPNVDEVLDTEDYYFSLVFDGGYPTEVKDSIFELVRNLRKDCVGIVDNGDNSSPRSALYSRQYKHKYNTYHMALYECYSNIYDMYTGRYLWITPVYHMANLIPYTDTVGEIWWAAAGFNRGTLDTIRVARYSPRLGERDQFYLNQINPIVKFNVGYTVWGQLTTQKRPTALQDLNIVRLVLYIKRALEQFCKYYIFELNNEDTWNRISSNINLFLNVIKEKRGLYSYAVEVGATEYEIKAKQVHVNVTLNPTRVIEQIHLNMFIV